VSATEPTIRELIELPKRVRQTRPRAVSHPSHKSVNVELIADAPGTLLGIIRVNQRMIESFSCILRYDPPKGRPVLLLRVNGDHGPHKDIVGGPHAHVHAPERLDFPPEYGTEPDWGLIVDPDCRLLGHAWAEFCRRANVAHSEKMARLVAKLHTALAQATLDDFFALHGNAVGDGPEEPW
jgi:hypothetical protein